VFEGPRWPAPPQDAAANRSRRIASTVSTASTKRSVRPAVALSITAGLALNVFHLGLYRLSVDIDLNYIGALIGR